MLFGSQHRQCASQPLWCCAKISTPCEKKKQTHFVFYVLLFILNVTSVSSESSATFDQLTNNHYSKKLHTFVISLRLPIWTERRGRRNIRPMWVVCFCVCLLTHNVVQYLSKGHVIVCVHKISCLCWREVLWSCDILSCCDFWKHMLMLYCIELCFQKQCFVFSLSSGDVIPQGDDLCCLCVEHHSVVLWFVGLFILQMKPFRG